MKKIRLTAFLLPFRPTGLFISILAISTLNVLQQARSVEWKPCFGNLHSHTAASDGVDNATEAYPWAHTEGHLNFLFLSKHNHMTTQTGLLDNQAAADAAVSVDFVGLVGQEFSTLPPNGGNHVNIHDLLTPVPAGLNNDYRTVFHTFLPITLRPIQTPLWFASSIILIIPTVITGLRRSEVFELPGRP